MNLIELHILQSFPVTCLNRDDLGAPKSAIFGGVERARVSSQCWKRAVREYAHDSCPDLFGASRSKILGPAIVKAAQSLGADDALAAAVREIALLALGKDKARDGWVKTLFFFSPESMQNAVRTLLESDQKDDLPAIAEALLSGDDKKVKKAEKAAEKLAKNFVKAFGESVSDAADIALFGRMVADDASQTVEGAALFSHALSTHAVRSELDFFSAVDDEKKNADDHGAGQIGDIEYNSACYYRYVGVNLDLLAKNATLFDQAKTKAVLENFIRAAVCANPDARKNSMFGQSLPSYVLALRRRGQPLSLANAFEKAVVAKQGGYVAPSVTALKKEWADLKAAFGLDAAVECESEKGREGTDSLASVLEKLLADPS